jgi:RNA polymerase sigma factor (sigma-70 family)
MTHEALWTAYHNATDKAEPKRALMAAYWPYVWGVAKRVARDHGFAFDAAELASEGAFGLSVAIDRFNPSRGCAFTTYATKYIDGRMRDFLRGPQGIPQLRRLKKKQSNPAYSVTGTPLAPDNLLGNELSSAPPPWEAAERDDEFEKWIRSLCPDDRAVMRAYYRDGRTLREIGAGLGVTENAACQMKHRALKWLRIAHVNVHERRAG